MLGRFTQRPSIKTTPAQCPAAAKGFIKLILCAMQELPSRQASNVGSTLVHRLRRWTNATPKSIQRLASARHPQLKISRADPPAKLETTTQSGFTSGPPFQVGENSD